MVNDTAWEGLRGFSVDHQQKQLTLATIIGGGRDSTMMKKIYDKLNGFQHKIPQKILRLPIL